MLEGLKVVGVRVLRWSEQYTKTNMVYLAKGGFWLLLGHAIQLSAGVILAIAFANLLPKEIYGTYQFIMSGAVIISSFTLSGMATAVARAVARGSEGALRHGFRIQIWWSVGIVLAGGILAAYYFINENYTLALSFLIAGAFSPFLGGFGLVKSYFVGKQLFKESALFGIGRRFIPVICILTTILLTHNPVILILVYFASNTLSGALLYALVVRRHNLPKHEEHDMVSYSKHLSLLKTFGDIVSQADKVLIWVFLGAAPLASYFLAHLMVRHIKEIFGLIYPLAFSKLSTTDFATLKQTLPHKVRAFLLIMIPVVALYIAVAPFIFTIMFPAYPESILPSQVLALTLFAKPRSLYGQAFAAHKMKRQQYIISITTGLVQVGLLATLIPFFGIWGAIYALLSSYLYSTLLTRYLFAKTTI